MVEWLGLTERLTVPWLDDRPTEVTQDELISRLGTDSLGMLDRLVDAGLLKRRADGGFDVPSPALLDMLGELDRRGYRLGHLLEGGRRHPPPSGSGVDEVVNSSWPGWARVSDAATGRWSCRRPSMHYARSATTRAVLLIFEQEVKHLSAPRVGPR